MNNAGHASFSMHPSKANSSITSRSDIQRPKEES
jgi:hypothetical protein